MIRRLFQEAEWWQVYDLCETIVKLSRDQNTTATLIDSIFAEENVPYVMKPDGINWRFSHPAAETIPEATALLVGDPALRGPAQQLA